MYTWGILLVKQEPFWTPMLNINHWKMLEFTMCCVLRSYLFSMILLDLSVHMNSALHDYILYIKLIFHSVWMVRLESSVFLVFLESILFLVWHSNRCVNSYSYGTPQLSPPEELLIFLLKFLSSTQFLCCCISNLCGTSMHVLGTPRDFKWTRMPHCVRNGTEMVSSSKGVQSQFDFKFQTLSTSENRVT